MMVKGMGIKTRVDFENLDALSVAVDYRREGRANFAALHKSAQKNQSNRFKSKQRNVNAVEALREWGQKHIVNHYSIYSLSEELFNLGHDRLTEWRYAKKVHTAFYQLALRQMEKDDEQSSKPDEHKLRLMPFVLNLSDLFQKKMVKSKKAEMNYCWRRVTEALKKALGRSPEMWFQYEMAPKANKGKPHIQGAMLISIEEKDLVTQAFHKVNGKVDANFKRYAFRLCLDKRLLWANQHGILYTDLNWASYCAKEAGMTRLVFADQDSDEPAKLVAQTHSINSMAKLIYEELRSSLHATTQQLITF